MALLADLLKQWNFSIGDFRSRIYKYVLYVYLESSRICEHASRALFQLENSVVLLNQSTGRE